MESSCPVCDAQLQTPSPDENGYFEIECRRCGKFALARDLRDSIRLGNPGLDRVKLTVGIRHASERNRVNGGSVVVNLDNASEYIAPVIFGTDPLNAADEILIWVRDHLPSFSDSFALSPEFDYTLFSLKKPDECKVALRLACDMNWVLHGSSANSYAQVSILPDGWRRVNELRNTTKASRQAFVAMRFSDDMLAVYESAIKPAIVETGFSPFIVNNNPNNNPIDDEIIAAIRRSAFLVADFTDQRTGVFFEAGFGLGLGLEVIWTIRKDQESQIKEHFDTRQRPHVLWNSPEDLRTQLKRRILATINGAKTIERKSRPS